MEELEVPQEVLADVGNILDRIRPGGMTLIENESTIGVELALYTLIQYAKRKGLKVIVEDVLDVLSIYIKHLRMMGLDVDVDSIDVIKIGGSEECGNVVRKIDPSEDPAVYTKKVDSILNKEKGKVLHISLGLERYLAFQRDFGSIYNLVSAIKANLGLDDRFNVYIVEVPILRGLELDPLPLLEDIATSVVYLKDVEGYIWVRFRKSVFTLVYGVNRTVLSPKDVIEWAKGIAGEKE